MDLVSAAAQVIHQTIKGMALLSPLPLEGERVRVRGNAIAFPLPIIVLSGPGEPADKHKVMQGGVGIGLPSSAQWL
jgi:hypothetical protein